MAVSRVQALATVTPISNQVLTIAGAITTEGAAKPGFITAVEVEAYQVSTSTVTQAAQVYVKFFDVDLAANVNADHVTSLVMALPVPTRVASGRLSHKFIFPGRGVAFASGIQMCIDTTIGGSTAATTTSKPNQVTVFWTEY